MKILPSNPALSSGKASESPDAGRSREVSTQKTSPTGGSDSIQLSSLSTQLQSIASSLSGPEFDQAKVDEIKDAIRSGSLKVNAEVVADRMLTNAHEWMTKQAS